MHGIMRVLAVLFAAILLLACAGCRGEKPPSAEMRVDGADVDLHLRAVGEVDSGEVLIAVHGGPGMSSDYLLSLEALAGRELAVVTYDQRGCGRSGQPTGGYTLSEYVADLEAVRRAVGAGQVHLLGHSWGGVVALRYATVHPQRVRSLILLGSGPPSGASVTAGQGAMGERIAALQLEGVIPQPITRMADILPAYFSDPGFQPPAELENASYNDEVERRTWSALGDYDFTAEVGRLEHRVLLLWGRDDPFRPALAPATQRALTSAQIEVVVLEGCGHFWHECPQPFFSHVRAFLGQPAGDSG
jgi:pimeloyl-ACP methyl ester carboxylesterase